MAFDATLSRLAEAASALNDASDGLNKTIKSVDEAVRATGIGVPVWLHQVVVATERKLTEGPYGTGKGWVVGYDKVEGTWCLAAKEIEWDSGYFEGDRDCPYQDRGDVGEPVQLRNAPREVRVRASLVLQDLLDALANEADRITSAVTELAEEYNPRTRSRVTPAGFFVTEISEEELPFDWTLESITAAGANVLLNRSDLIRWMAPLQKARSSGTRLEPTYTTLSMEMVPIGYDEHTPLGANIGPMIGPVIVWLRDRMPDSTFLLISDESVDDVEDIRGWLARKLDALRRVRRG